MKKLFALVVLLSVVLGVKAETGNSSHTVEWVEWEKNEVVIRETAVHKSLVQTASRMKQRGYDINEICKITGLSREEIEAL